MSQEADAWVAVEQFLQTSVASDKQYAESRNQGYPNIAIAFHFHQYNGTHNQRYACKHLVGDTEQRPERVDTTQRVGYAGIEEVTPQCHGQECCNQVGRDRVGVTEWFVEDTAQVLNHETGNACTGVNRGQNEQGFKQQGKVIPERHHGFARNQTAHNVCHTDCEGWRTACTRQNGVFAYFFSSVQQGCGINREVQFSGDDFGSCVGIRTNQRGRAVHREVHAWIKRSGGGQSHNGHKAFHNHAAVTDHTDVGFVFHHFWRGT